MLLRVGLEVQAMLRERELMGVPNEGSGSVLNAASKSVLGHTIPMTTNDLSLNLTLPLDHPIMCIVEQLDTTDIRTMTVADFIEEQEDFHEDGEEGYPRTLEAVSILQRRTILDESDDDQSVLLYILRDMSGSYEQLQAWKEDHGIGGDGN